MQFQSSELSLTKGVIWARRKTRSFQHQASNEGGGVTYPYIKKRKILRASRRTDIRINQCRRAALSSSLEKRTWVGVRRAGRSDAITHTHWLHRELNCCQKREECDTRTKKILINTENVRWWLPSEERIEGDGRLHEATFCRRHLRSSAQHSFMDQGSKFMMIRSARQ